MSFEDQLSFIERGELRLVRRYSAFTIHKLRAEAKSEIAFTVGRLTDTSAPSANVNVNGSNPKPKQNTADRSPSPLCPPAAHTLPTAERPHKTSFQVSNLIGYYQSISVSVPLWRISHCLTTASVHCYRRLRIFRY